MIIPKYWAKAGRTEHFTAEKSGKLVRRQITFSRFGWSSLSQQDAELHAQTRLDDAIKSGSLVKHETKVPYNGAHGLPIREEIVEERGEHILTRNSYGALCLNTPNVLIVDVDLEYIGNVRWDILCVLGLGAFVVMSLLGIGFGVSAVSSMLVVILSYFSWRGAFFLYKTLSGGVLGLIRKKLLDYPDTSWRIYKTPAGYRLFEISKAWNARDKDTIDMMKSLTSDPMYMRMCVMQDCFRARVSPKPWRIGVERLRDPVWPISDDKLPARRKWVLSYMDASKHFAACELIEGSDGFGTESCRQFVLWHDSLACHEGQPLA